MQASTLIKQSEDDIQLMDYKQFIREFESYRNQNPEESFQHALDTFLEEPAREPELARS